MNKLEGYNSIYADPAPLTDRDEYFAMDPEGKVYSVKEYYSEDKRRKGGKRFNRTDADTGECLLQTQLCVLPPDFKDEKSWLMKTMREMMNEINDLKYDLEMERISIRENEII